MKLVTSTSRRKLNLIILFHFFVIVFLFNSHESEAQYKNASDLLLCESKNETSKYGFTRLKRQKGTYHRIIRWKNKRDYKPFIDRVILFFSAPYRRYEHYTDSIDAISAAMTERDLFNFLSQIDSLNIIDYANDTIYLFHYDGEYLLESSRHNIAKGRYYWSQNRQEFVRNQDTIVHKVKDSTQFRVSWLPIYMRNALVEEDFNLLSTMCSWYEQQESQWVGGDEYYSPDPHFVCYKMIINEGKLVNRTKFDFEFHDKTYNLLDDIYNEVERLKSEGKVLKSNNLGKRSTILKNGIGLILDSIYREAPYYSILEHNSQILKWEEDYVLPLIDSLDLIDYSNDTIYYELCYSKNGLGKNRAKILTNTKHMYLYESFIGIVWDTLRVSDIDKYDSGFVLDNWITTMHERYVLYNLPGFPYSSFFLYRMTFDWRTYYYYKYSKPFGNVNTRYLIDSLNVANQNVKLQRGDMGVCIRTRIEFKDGKVSDVVTQMRLDDNGLW